MIESGLVLFREFPVASSSLLHVIQIITLLIVSIFLKSISIRCCMALQLSGASVDPASRPRSSTVFVLPTVKCENMSLRHPPMSWRPG